MAVPCSQEFGTESGPRRADALVALPPDQAWHTLSCGQGAKGPRLYDWALMDTSSPAHRLLVRRSLANPSQLAVNEVRRLHATLTCPAHSLGHVLAWSRWRRRHQARARHCHYRRRLERFLELAASRPGP